jgi:hypothetical protein
MKDFFKLLISYVALANLCKKLSICLCKHLKTLRLLKTYVEC